MQKPIVLLSILTLINGLSISNNLNRGSPINSGKILTINSNIGGNIKYLIESSKNGNTYRFDFSQRQNIKKIKKIVKKITHYKSAKYYDYDINQIPAVEYNNKIIFDLNSPNFNIGKIENQFLPINHILKLDLDVEKGANRVYFPLCLYNEYFYIDQVIYLNYGDIKLRIINKSFNNNQPFLETIVEKPGYIKSFTNVNVPHFNPDLEILKYFIKDNEKIIRLAKELSVDYLTVPWVKTRDQINYLKNKYLMDSDIKLISKIETPQAIDNIENIIKISDAIMISRRNLITELGYLNFFDVKNMILKTAKQNDTPVIADYETIHYV